MRKNKKKVDFIDLDSVITLMTLLQAMAGAIGILSTLGLILALLYEGTFVVIYAVSIFLNILVVTLAFPAKKFLQKRKEFDETCRKK